MTDRELLNDIRDLLAESRDWLAEIHSKLEERPALASSVHGDVTINVGEPRQEPTND